jgi:c-di-GMP-related signal transduction protein
MEVFVARQPIFDRSKQTIAYELLYRNNDINSFPNIDGDQATADVIINSFLNIGIDSLSAGKPCFINFTANLLKLKVPTFFNPREIVVEILETIEPNAEIVEICKELRRLGYKLALDDFVLQENNPYCNELMKLADYVKVDFLATNGIKRNKIEVLANLLGFKLLAEKVETQEDFMEAKEKGYHYFQGYFFSKPKILSTYDVPAYFHSHYSVIQSLEMKEPSIDLIAQLIEQDLSLSYKLLKLINSPAYRPKHKISSIRQAIMLLGLFEIQRWIYVLAVREQTGKKEQLENEVIKLCLARAKMCELIASHSIPNESRSSYFLTGLFSLMETILGVPMETILKELPLLDDIGDALRGIPNRMKEVLDLVIAIEQANWKTVEELTDKLGFTQKEISHFYQNACQWSEQLLIQEDELAK